MFAELGAILTCSVYLYFSNICVESAFPKIKPFTVKILTIILLYILDVFYFVDMSVKVEFFHGKLSWISGLTQLILIFSLLFVAISNKTQKNKLNPKNIGVLK